MRFYIGLHHPFKAQHFEQSCISINAVRERKSPVPADCWMMDSGAFSEIAQYGRYRQEPAQYADEVARLARLNPGLELAVSQDWMCEPSMLERTGLDIATHQELTISRYITLAALIKAVPLMPVLQGHSIADYVKHIGMYGRLLQPNMRVGVGSVCKRNSVAGEVEAIVLAIKRERPDLRLHGFGLKITALKSALVRDNLYSADSMAWSFTARKEGRDPNSLQEALRFVKAIERQSVQLGWAF